MVMSKSYVMNAAARIRRLEQLQQLKRFVENEGGRRFVVARKGLLGLPTGPTFIDVDADTLSEIVGELAARETKALTELGVTNGGSDHPIQSGQTDRT